MPIPTTSKPQVRENEDFDEPQSFCNIDDDNDNLPFSQSLRNALVPSHFMPPKISKYDEGVIL